MGHTRWTAFSKLVFKILLALVCACSLPSMADEGTGTPNTGEPVDDLVEHQQPLECSVKRPPPSWNKPLYIYIWDQVCKGEAADLIYKFGQLKDVDTGFLRTILLEEPYRSAIPQGVTIIGARFREKLDLSGATLKSRLQILASEFKDGLDASGVTGESLILMLSVFSGDEPSGVIDLSNSHFNGFVSMAGISVKGKVSMNSIRVDTNLLIKDYDLEPEQVNILPKELREGLLYEHEDKSKPGGDPKPKRVASVFEADIDLMGANIGGTFLIAGGIFHGKHISMYKLNSGGDVRITGADMSGKDQPGNTDQNAGVNRALDFTDMTIGGSLRFGMSTLPSLDLTGSTIKHALAFGYSDTEPDDKAYPVKWTPRAFLNLSNVSANTLVDYEPECDEKKCEINSWPWKTELHGFTFDHVNMDETLRSSMGSRPNEWFKQWLERDPDFTPQPYEQLASVLERHGYHDKADGIRMRQKWHEVAEAFTGDISFVKFIRGIGLLVGGMLVAFGIAGYAPFYIVLWIVFFVTVCASAIRFSKQEEKKKMLPRFPVAYSFDMFIPLIRLRESHYRICFSGCLQNYLYIHKIMGYVMAGVLVATLFPK